MQQLSRRRSSGLELTRPNLSFFLATTTFPPLQLPKIPFVSSFSLPSTFPSHPTSSATSVNCSRHQTPADDAFTIRIVVPRASFRDLAAGRLIPPSTRQPANFPRAHQDLRCCRRPPRRAAAHIALSIWNDVPRAGLQASPAPRHINQRVPPSLSGVFAVGAVVGAPRSGAFSVDDMSFLPESGTSELSAAGRLASPFRISTSESHCLLARHSSSSLPPRRNAIPLTRCIAVRRAAFPDFVIYGRFFLTSVTQSDVDYSAYYLTQILTNPLSPSRPRERRFQSFKISPWCGLALQHQPPRSKFDFRRSRERHLQKLIFSAARPSSSSTQPQPKFDFCVSAERHLQNFSSRCAGHFFGTNDDFPFRKFEISRSRERGLELYVVQRHISFFSLRAALTSSNSSIHEFQSNYQVPENEEIFFAARLPRSPP
ncbi:hypothetical protein R3P38DRAFT_3199085 [Favolaschia claudopus]|uniref:Uncharacterized protein n=1 Tax=Favolaschia claudopus TaxID=2862362 RepID=A0AAW0B0S6_9AGAR